MMGENLILFFVSFLTCDGWAALDDTSTMLALYVVLWNFTTGSIPVSISKGIAFSSSKIVIRNIFHMVS